MYVVSKINYQTFRWMAPSRWWGLSSCCCWSTPWAWSATAPPVVKLGIEFQPSEFAKIAVILFFAARLCKRDTEKHKRYKNRSFFGRLYNLLDRIGFIELVPYMLVLGVVAGLVVFQPHMSGTLLILAGGASVLFAAGIHWGWFLAGGSLVGGLAAIIIAFTPYMNARIDLWQNPWNYIQGNGYQTVQSLIAMGSGGLLPGRQQSMQKMLDSPELRMTSSFPLWWRSWAL